jgi:AmmeMemoRadiSam system protein A
MISADVRRQLLEYARSSLVARVAGGAPPEPSGDLTVEGFGVFVTIHCRGDLRGCLGALDCADRLVESIVRLAGAVSCEDYRFRALSPAELAHTVIDVSVLTPPEPVTDFSTIEVGRHGLIVEHRGRRGLLLPQVAPEHRWDRDTFLAHTCLKAGLPPTAWQRDATVWRFEAEVFSERALVRG